MSIKQTILTVIFLTIILPAAAQDHDCYNVEELCSEQREGYSCTLVRFNAHDGDSISAYILMPDNASQDNPVPGIVMMHDHGARFDIGKEKLVKPICRNPDHAEEAGAGFPYGAPGHISASAKEWSDKYFDGVFFGDFLASEGYAVIAVDALYWGERSCQEAQEWSRLTFCKEERQSMSREARDSVKNRIKKLKLQVYEGQREIYAGLAADGKCWAGKILEDDIASAELLASMPCVDSSRIGAFGFSMGAHRCWLLSAFCDRIKCGAAACWMTLKSSYDSDNASDLSMRIPALRDTMDFPEIAELLKPKTMLFVSGREDHLFPEAVVEAAFQTMNEIYGEDQAALTTCFSEGGHRCGKSVQILVSKFFKDKL